jgi:OmpA-OmpF porin, OOP family
MKKHILAAAAVLAFSGAASAQWYGTVSAGMSRQSIDCTGAPNCDETGTAFKILGGYKFTPNIAAEAGYFSFGKGTASDSSASLDFKTTLFGAGVAFHGDFAPSWTGVARLGVGRVKTKLDATVVGLGSASESDTNTSLYGGVGVGYRLQRNLTIDGSIDFTKSKFNNLGLDESWNATAFSVGVTYSF